MGTAACLTRSGATVFQKRGDTRWRARRSWHLSSELLRMADLTWRSTPFDRPGRWQPTSCFCSTRSAFQKLRDDARGTTKSPSTGPNLANSCHVGLGVLRAGPLLHHLLTLREVHHPRVAVISCSDVSIYRRSLHEIAGCLVRHVLAPKILPRSQCCSASIFESLSTVEVCVLSASLRGDVTGGLPKRMVGRHTPETDGDKVLRQYSPDSLCAFVSKLP